MQKLSTCLACDRRLMQLVLWFLKGFNRCHVAKWRACWDDAERVLNLEPMYFFLMYTQPTKSEVTARASCKVVLKITLSTSPHVCRFLEGDLQGYKFDDLFQRSPFFVWKLQLQGQGDGRETFLEAKAASSGAFWGLLCVCCFRTLVGCWLECTKNWFLTH